MRLAARRRERGQTGCNFRRQHYRRLLQRAVPPHVVLRSRTKAVLTADALAFWTKLEGEFDECAARQDERRSLRRHPEADQFRRVRGRPASTVREGILRTLQRVPPDRARRAGTPAR